MKRNIKCESQVEMFLSTIIDSKHKICMVFLSYKIFIFIKVINITGRPTFDCCCFVATNLCKRLLYLLLIFIVHIKCQWQNVMLKSFLKSAKGLWYLPVNNKYRLRIQMNLPKTLSWTPERLQPCVTMTSCRGRFSFAPVVQVHYYYYHYYLYLLTNALKQ